MASATLEEVLAFCKEVVDVYVDRCYSDPTIVDKGAIYERIKDAVTEFHAHDPTAPFDTPQYSRVDVSSRAGRKVTPLEKMLKKIRSAKTGVAMDKIISEKTHRKLILHFMSWIMARVPHKPGSHLYNQDYNIAYNRFYHTFQVFCELEPTLRSYEVS